MTQTKIEERQKEVKMVHPEIKDTEMETRLAELEKVDALVVEGETSIEDDVVVTVDGCRSLTSFTRDLITVG